MARIGGGVSEMLDDIVGEVNGAATSIYLTAIAPRCSGEVDDVVGYWYSVRFRRGLGSQRGREERVAAMKSDGNLPLLPRLRRFSGELARAG
jgi:hypothetical protein